MTRALGFTVVTLLLAACANEAPNLSAKYAAKESALEHDVDALTVWPSCESAPKGAQTCGLIWDQVSKPEVMSSFVRTRCGEQIESASTECLEQFYAAYMRSMRDRYDLVDGRAVLSRCSKFDGRCEAEPAFFELQWLKSHNEGVRDRALGQKVALRDSRTREEATMAAEARAENERTQAAVRAFGAGLQRAAEAWQGPHLLCCDGQRSPSCRCSASSHQGCCSDHGGVCGCAGE